MELHYAEIGYPRITVKTKEGKDLTFEPNNVCFMGWAINKKTEEVSHQIYTAPYEESDYELFELSTDTFYELRSAMKDFIKDGMFEISVDAYDKDGFDIPVIKDFEYDTIWTTSIDRLFTKNIFGDTEEDEQDE